MEPTRIRILVYLKKHLSATAEELGHSLGMTGANIRHHLSRMLKDGQIVELDRRQEGKGRPTVVYGASERVLGNGLQDLLESALSTWLEAAPEAKHDLLLKQLAERLAGTELSGPAGASQRLGQAVERLNTLHYQARWEAGSRGPRMILGRCPYAEIISRHPELCRMDQYLLEALSGLKASQSIKLERGRDGVMRCVFQLG
jgi:predicted ArsR family transcriptional regulator